MHSNAPAISAAVAAILAELDADVAARKPVCKASGKCCKFEEYDHYLFVTAAELVHFNLTRPEIKNSKSEIKNPVSLPQFFANPSYTGCPWQIDGLCTARDARPLGCRIFFCDENTKSWMDEVYEKYHQKLVKVHEQFDLPYRYLEWRAALRELL